MLARLMKSGIYFAPIRARTAGCEESWTKERWFLLALASPQRSLPISVSPALTLKLVSCIPQYDSGPSQAAASVSELGASLCVLEPCKISVSVSHNPGT